jgi:hypothetical protein
MPQPAAARLPAYYTVVQHHPSPSQRYYARCLGRNKEHYAPCFSVPGGAAHGMHAHLGLGPTRLLGSASVAGTSSMQWRRAEGRACMRSCGRARWGIRSLGTEGGSMGFARDRWPSSSQGKFRLWKNFKPMNSATFVLFVKYCSIMDQLGSKDSSRDFSTKLCN